MARDGEDSSPLLSAFEWRDVGPMRGGRVFGVAGHASQPDTFYFGNLAGESGLTLMNYLKRNHPEAAILLVTGMDHDDITIRSMLDMGADQYLRKGSMDELLVTIGSYFKQLS